MVICLERGADLHMAQMMPLPLTVFCFSKVQIGFTFLVPAYPGSTGQRAVECVCVCVCVWYKYYGRAFPVAGPTIWNSLPDSVISAPSLSTFRQRLKTFLFQASFPDIITDTR